MNKDAVRVNQIDLPAIFPSLRLLESLRTAWSIPCLMAAAIVYAGFHVDFGGSFKNESPYLTATLTPFISRTLAQGMDNIEAIFVQGSAYGWGGIATLIVRMLCLGFGAVGIARFGGLLVTRHQRSGILRTVRFTAGSWKPVIVSTSLTLTIGLMGLQFFRIVGHLSAWISSEPNVVSLSNIIFWLCSFVTLIGLYVLLTGWLLGLSAIAVDQVDGAEALSRGISYVLSRFRRASCCLILNALIAYIVAQVTSWAVTVSGSVALRSIDPDSQLSASLTGGFNTFRTGFVECVQLSTFCCGLTLAYLILRQMVDNVDHREISDQK